MIGWLSARWQRALEGFLVVPGLVALAHVALAFGLVRTDAALGAERTAFFFGGDANAARGILETIAGSLITVAGLAFSLTIVVLALVSSQFSPRATPGFLADRLNQLIAGTFVGIFGYCLVILRSVRTEVEATGAGFIPRVSVTVGIVLAFVALGLLLVFIHHMGKSIHVSRLASRVAADTAREIERRHPYDPETAGMGFAGPPGAPPPREGSSAVGAAHPGFVLSIELEGILEALDTPGVRIAVDVRGGDFVTTATPLVRVWPPGALSEEARACVSRCIVIGPERSLHGDAGYGIRQLADIVAKALSPGVNDATTAIDCISHLRELLEQLAVRELPAALRLAGPRGAHLTAVRPTFDEYLASAFNEAARYASDNARVVVSLLDALHAIGRVAEDGHHGSGRVASVIDLAHAVAGPALADARTERDTRIIHEGMAWMERSVS